MCDAYFGMQSYVVSTFEMGKGSTSSSSAKEKHMHSIERKLDVSCDCISEVIWTDKLEIKLNTIFNIAKILLS